MLAINLSNILYGLKADPHPKALPMNTKPDDIAYLFHTSGTSSGVPKAIPQTHHGAVGVLPRLPGYQNVAAFSTTPLYHGGIADCLRAWTSGATVHLFPGTQPVTTANIHRTIKRANEYLTSACPVRYFTSVPYILQMLLAASSDPAASSGEAASPLSGLALLQAMELVGVGGAALPQSLGDELVSKGVKLISRYGSAECGFLLTSERDYEKDHDWSYLRSNPSLQPNYYDFEPQTRQEDEINIDIPQLYQFVVKPKWPHRGKTNRSDGSFATADLFEAHPTIPNAWRYHSRADSLITLVNGKKFDPAPLEGEILASEIGKRLLADAMLIGAGREAAGLLVIPKWDNTISDINSTEQIRDELWPTIERMNKATQNHARIGHGQIVVVRKGAGKATPALPKSSKGTILRHQAERMFEKEIEEAFNGVSGSDHELAHIPDSQVLNELTRLFESVLRRQINPRTDLFAQGVDSIACSQLRKSMSKRFFADSDEITLPLNVVYEQGSIERLSSYILRCRVSGTAVISHHCEDDGENAEEQLMLDLVDKYRHGTKTPTGSFDHSQNRVVVLTGATGFLGAHILDLLLQDPKVCQIFCLVRARDASGATDRIAQSLQSRGLAAVTEAQIKTKVVCLPATLSEPRLGLSEKDWKYLASRTTIVLHAAWLVNFNLHLRSFEPQLAGLRNLLQLRNATHCSAARFVFISSTAAVSAQGGFSGRRTTHAIPETLSSEPEDAAPMGYARSKWVAENICCAARVRLGASPSTVIPPTLSPVDSEYSSPASPSLSTAEEEAPIILIRVGQLCGNARGVWNATEAFPIMLSSAQKITGCLPNLREQSLSWLPVDIAARSVLELSVADDYEDAGPSGRVWKYQKTLVYHVASPYNEPTWLDMLQWIASPPSERERTKDETIEEGSENSSDFHPGHNEASKAVRVVSPDAWLRSLEDALETREHPARSLLHLWKEAYGRGRETHGPIFETRRAEVASQTMRDVEPLSQEDVLRMWEWIRVNV